MVKITIPGRLPGYNELTKGGWRKGHRLKSQAMETVGWVLKAAQVEPIQGRAVVKITCHEPTLKRDPSNVRAGAEKIILDALQNAGVIRNDNWRWLEDCPTRVLLDRDRPRVEVEIGEA